ncbi:hypothetical protein H4R33_003660 [Dimargaris cristalligena]|nr:hypothetical protein H4R33_003660 [Dimargaris cristalligena]
MSLSSDEDGFLELEIVDEAVFLKQQRLDTMSSLLTGHNKLQPLLTSPEKRPSSTQGFLKGRLSQTEVGSPVKASGSSGHTPAGIAHKQLNQLLTHKILQSSSQRRLKELSKLPATPASAEPEPVLADHGSDVKNALESNLPGCHADDADSELEGSELESTGEDSKPEDAEGLDNLESVSLVSENAESDDDNSGDGDDDDDDDGPILKKRHTRSSLIHQSGVVSPVEGNSTQGSPELRPATALFPLFARRPQIKSHPMASAPPSATPMSTDATLTISPTSHARLGQGVATPLAVSPDDALVDSMGLGRPTLDGVLASSDQWFDSQCFANIPSPSQDSLCDTMSALGDDHQYPKSPTPVRFAPASQSPRDTAIPFSDTQPLTPTQPLPLSDEGLTDLTPTQLLPVEDLTLAYPMATTPPVENPSLPARSLNRLIRRSGLGPTGRSGARSGKVRKQRPRSEFVDAEAEEGESDDDTTFFGGGGQTQLLPFGQRTIAGLTVGADGQPHPNEANGKAVGGGGEDEDEDEENPDLDEWDENDSMVAFSGEEESGDEYDPELMRQYHHDRERDEDSVAVATLYRDITEGKLAARAKQRRLKRGGQLDGNRDNLGDWVDGAVDEEIADRERRRLMWKQGLKLGQQRDRGEDIAFAKLSKLALNPETAAFARVAQHLGGPAPEDDQLVNPIETADDTTVNEVGSVDADDNDDNDDDGEINASDESVDLPFIHPHSFKSHRQEASTSLSDPLSALLLDSSGPSVNIASMISTRSVLVTAPLLTGNGSTREASSTRKWATDSGNAGAEVFKFARCPRNTGSHVAQGSGGGASDFTVDRPSKLKRFLPDTQLGDSNSSGGGSGTGSSASGAAIPRKTGGSRTYGFSALMTGKTASENTQSPSNSQSSVPDSRSLSQPLEKRRKLGEPSTPNRTKSATSSSQSPAPPALTKSSNRMATVDHR